MYKSIILVAIIVAFAEVNAELAGFSSIAARDQQPSDSQSAAASLSIASGPTTKDDGHDGSSSDKNDAPDQLSQAVAPENDPSAKENDVDQSKTTPTDSAIDPKASPDQKAEGDKSKVPDSMKPQDDSSMNLKAGPGSAAKSPDTDKMASTNPKAAGAHADSANPGSSKPIGRRSDPSTAGTEGGGPAPTPNTPGSAAASDPFAEGNDSKQDKKEPYSGGQPPASVPGDMSSGKCMCPAPPTCGAAPSPLPPPPAPETSPNGTANDSSSQPAPDGGADADKDDSDKDNAAGSLATPEATVVTGLVATALALFAL